jgi:hypothetical protein
MHALIPALLQGTVDETKLYAYLSAKGHRDRNKDGGLGRKFQEKTRHELIKKAFDFTGATPQLNDINALKELGEAFANPGKTRGIKKKNINKAAICFALIYYYGKQDVKQALVVEDALNQLSALYAGPFKEQCMTLHEPHMADVELVPSYISVFVHQTISEFIEGKRKAFKNFCDSHAAEAKETKAEEKTEKTSLTNSLPSEPKETIAATLNPPVSEKIALNDTMPSKSSAPSETVAAVVAPKAALTEKAPRFASESKEEINAILNPGAPQPPRSPQLRGLSLNPEANISALNLSDAASQPETHPVTAASAETTPFVVTIHPDAEQKTANEPVNLPAPANSLSLTADLPSESKTATPPAQENLTYEDMLISLAATDHLLTEEPNAVFADKVYRKAKQLELFTKLCNERLPLEQVIRLNSHMQAVQDGAEEDNQFNLARTERIFLSDYGNTTTWKNMRSAAKKAEIDKLKLKNPSGVLSDADFERYAQRANQHSGRWYERLGNTNSHQYYCSMFSRESEKKEAAEVQQAASAAHKKLK